MSAPLFPTYRVDASDLRVGDTVILAHEPAEIAGRRMLCGYVDLDIVRVDGVLGRYQLKPELPVVLLAREAA